MNKDTISKGHNIEGQLNNSPLKNRLFFAFLLGLLIVERLYVLFFFSSKYTDADQIIMWNGAIDYSHGVFQEPFFYGQAYNYMLESILSVPLLWLGVPVQIAVPISTSLLAIFPFLLLAIFFFKRKHFFWAYLTLALPFLLPLSYTLLTAIPRGFVQAHMFAPLLFIPLLEPKNTKNIIYLHIGSVLCFISNQSSILIVLPIFIYVYSFHVRSLSFYLKALFTIPFLLIDYYSKLFYVHHPEKVVHEIVGMKLDKETFINSIQNPLLFEDLSPFFSGWGWFYPISFVILAIIALVLKKNRAFIFLIVLVLFLLTTLAIPKTQELYPLPNAGIFFSTSRLYLFVPFLLIISLFLVFKNIKTNIRSVYLLVIVCLCMAIYKFYIFNETIEKTVLETSFPVTKNEDLLNRAKSYQNIVKSDKIDLIIHNTPEGWTYFFDAYSYHPILNSTNDEINKTISVSGSGDRRTWLYSNAVNRKVILLNGFKLDSTQLVSLDHKIINESQTIIKTNGATINELLNKLKIKFGNN